MSDMNDINFEFPFCFKFKEFARFLKFVVEMELNRLSKQGKNNRWERGQYLWERVASLLEVKAHWIIAKLADGVTVRTPCLEEFFKIVILALEV